VNNRIYLDLLEQRLVELLSELESDQERRAMMQELGLAAEEGGITAIGWSPRPEPENPWLWAADLLSNNDRALDVIRDKRVDERWPRPQDFECIEEIVSAFRPHHSLD
jgi:hypothetical protein